MSKLINLVLAPSPDIDAIAAYLDGLAPSVRIEQTRSLDPKSQRLLWKLTEGRVVSLLDLVPADRDPLEPVRHYGRNTLPAFTQFEKRFCRPPDTTGEDILWGYNEGSARPLVGPGYFVARGTGGDRRGAAVVDYYRVPTGKPDSWPAIKPNDSGVSKLVYGFMHDFLRRISTHVTIGRAWKHGKETPNHFVLCREG